MKLKRDERISRKADPDGPGASGEAEEGRGRIVWRAVVLGLVLGAIGLILATNSWLTERYLRDARARAEVRLALYASSIVSELKRTSVVPLLLARDPVLIAALGSADYSATTRRLIEIDREVGTAGLVLLDGDGVVVAATDRTALGENRRHAPYLVEALRADGTVFTVVADETGRPRFYYARRIGEDGRPLGVIAVEVDLARLEQSWAGGQEALMVIDSEGRIVLASAPAWRGRSVEEALAALPAPTAIERALRATADWAIPRPEAALGSAEILRLETRIPFHGWKLAYFTTTAPVRDRVNGVIAIEIMALAVLVALAAVITSRRARLQALLMRRESAELRRLNARLQREIEERERAERSLRVAEQTLAQSSKLAALGEMAAAVSHELNQPLAAMRTYLAGARLLLQRRRFDEALASLARVDDLIERMSAITRQLKFHARQGSEEPRPVDLREALAGALSMMAPQLDARQVAVSRTVPSEPVMVMGDQIRLEQVIVNLLRNALDATKGQPDPELDILITAGERARLVVRDNGAGIADLDRLFEPFYTTKSPGEGTGLGLAISSGIIKDYGGRLSARNLEPRGAQFEIELPLAPAGAAAGGGEAGAAAAPDAGQRARG